MDQYCRVSSPSHPLDISHLNFLGLGHQQIRFTSFGQHPYPPKGRFANRSPSVCPSPPVTQVVRDSLDQFEFDLPRRRELGLAEITVKIYRGQIMRKMGAKSLADLVRMSEALGIARTKGKVQT